MSDLPPSPFDDGGGLPDTTPRLAEPRRRQRRQVRRDLARDLDAHLATDGSVTPRDRDDSGAHDGRHAGGTPGGSGVRHRGPNYLFRRALAIAVVLAAVAVGAVVVSRMVGGDDESDASLPQVPWNTIALLAGDEVRLVDPDDGDLIDTITLVEDVATVQTTIVDTTLVTLDEGGRVGMVDLVEGTSRAARTASGATLQTLQGGLAVAGDPAGGDLTIIVPSTRTTIDLGPLADFDNPRILVDSARANDAGTHLAAADASTFQSVLVDIANETVQLFAGIVVALDDETVVIAQRAGSRAELEFYDLLGEEIGSVDGPAPEAIMLTGPTTALMVADDGSIHVIDAAKGSIEQIGELVDGVELDLRYGTAVHGGDRLLLGTEDTTYLVDDTGAVLATATGTLLAGGDHRTLGCAVIGGRTAASTNVHLDLATGEALGELPGAEPTASSVDGCTIVIGFGTATQVVQRGVGLEVDVPVGTNTLAPDGSVLVSVTRTEGIIALRTDADADAEPLQLADGVALVAFLER